METENEDKSIIPKSEDQSEIHGQSSMIDLPSKFELISDFSIFKRHLPHWQNPGCVYFVTFRTHKNLILSEKARDIISQVIKFNDKKKYTLFSFVVMPDHIHIILQPIEINNNNYYSLTEINHSIKSFSAKEINQIENQKGRIVWQHESFDRIIRNDEEFQEKMYYILNNSVKKNLSDSGYDYRWYYVVGQLS
jgi:putative transposase